MAEMDRAMYGAADREGKPLSSTARLLLALLWTYVDPEDAKAYRKTRDQPARQAPRIGEFRLEVVANLLGFELETIRRTIDRQLTPSGWVLRKGKQLALLDRAHRDAFLAAQHKFPALVKVEERGDPGQPSLADPGQRSEDPGQPSGIDRTTIRQIPDSHPPDPLRVPIGSQLGPESGSHALALAGEVSPNFFERAKEIVSRLTAPKGAAAIPTSLRGLRHLVQLLADGEDPTRLEAVLADAPAIVGASLQAASWYGPEMFCGERWSRWCNAHAQLLDRRRPVEVAEVATPKAPPVDASRNEVKWLLAQAENPRAPNDFELANPHFGLAHERALLHAPEAARLAARELQARAQSEGREVQLDELHAALGRAAPDAEPQRRRVWDPDAAERAEEQELAQRAVLVRRRAAQLAAIDEVASRDRAQAVLLLRSLLARHELDDEETRLVEQRLALLITAPHNPGEPK